MNKKYNFSKTSSVEEINQKVNSAIEKIFGYFEITKNN